MHNLSVCDQRNPAGRQYQYCTYILQDQINVPELSYVCVARVCHWCAWQLTSERVHPPACAPAARIRPTTRRASTPFCRE